MSETCKRCNGTGTIECPPCRGSGETVTPFSPDAVECGHCDAAGEIPCPDCDGNGKV